MGVHEGPMGYKKKKKGEKKGVGCQILPMGNGKSMRGGERAMRDGKSKEGEFLSYVLFLSTDDHIPRCFRGH